MAVTVSIVVPFYNEEENAPLLAEKIEHVFDALPDYAYECVFVNDGSADGTRAALDALGARNPRIRPVHLRSNRGQSAALVAGLRRATGDLLVTLDGDLQNDPADIPAILELLADHDCVCGYRANRRDTLTKRMSSRLANAVRQWAIGDGLRDTGCGLKGFRRKCVEHILPFNGVHRFIGALMRMAGCSVVECPVRHHPRVHGKSKYGIHNRLWRGIYDLFGVRWLQRRYVTFEVDGEESP